MVGFFAVFNSSFSSARWKINRNILQQKEVKGEVLKEENNQVQDTDG
jgi:hypothetical protein